MGGSVTNNFVSLTMNRLICDTLLARFFINPVPRSMSQTIAIYSYFANLTSHENLIQYRHARDTNSGNRLNHFRLLINDPLPPVDPKSLSFMLDKPATTPEETNQVLPGVSLDNSLLKGDASASAQKTLSNNISEGTGPEDYKNSDHAERIGVWRKNRLAVEQVSFPNRLDALAAKLRSLIDNNEQLHKDITLDTIKAAWAEIPAYSPVSSVLGSITVLNFEFQKSSGIHLTAQTDGTLLQGTVESKLIGTTQIILDNDTNTVVPLEEVLFDRFSADNGKLIQEYDATHAHHKFYDSQKYTFFNLKLSMLTREPRAIMYGSNMALQNKINSKNNRARVSGKLNGENNIVRLRDDALAGFTGSLGFEI